MNIPHYGKHPLRPTYEGKDVSNQIYCSSSLSLNGEEYYRYLWPDGWSKIAYYFKSRKEAEKAFQKCGQLILPPITKDEIADKEYQKRIMDYDLID